MSTSSDYRHADTNEIIAAFASNRAFRSARADELVNDTNPFRRPVRPHDLGLLDYGVPLRRDDFLSLSGLLGHRMLMNVYETEYLFLPDGADTPAWEGFRDFYAPESVTLGELARPILEHHLFSLLESSGATEADSIDEVSRVCKGLERRLLDSNSSASTLLESLRDPHSAAIFLLIQLTCGWQARSNVLTRGTLGDNMAVCPRLADLARQQTAEITRANLQLRKLLASAGLLARPRAYWQFYLTSSLAQTNNVYRLARDHGRLFELIGALAHQVICDRAFALKLQPTLAELVDATSCVETAEGSPLQNGSSGCGSSQIVSLIAPLVELYGQDNVLPPFLVGLNNAHDLYELAHDDLRRQIEWADDLGRYRAEAARLQGLIDSGSLAVDLDTFVESSAETSTTHVHDEHRLVVIESGNMVFWHNVDANVQLSAGDALLIPRTRLHGSVVLSGECTYHQPIIPEENMALNN